MSHRGVAAGLLLAAVGVGMPGPGAAGLVQDAGAGEVVGEAPLDRVEALARAGRAQEARVLLTEWWDGGGRDEASRDDLQRGIWLRGLLTVDPSQAALDFRRLVVEYPTGPFSPPALERVARAADLSGDREGAVRARERLVRDYPRTPEAERARRWLAAGG